MVSEPHGVPGRQGPFPRLSRDDDGRDSWNSVSESMISYYRVFIGAIATAWGSKY